MPWEGTKGNLLYIIVFKYFFFQEVLGGKTVCQPQIAEVTKWRQNVVNMTGVRLHEYGG